MTERWVRLAIVVLLAVYALQAAAGMRQKSMVTDEMVTFLPGYVELTKGDFRLTYEHPPLSKYIAALPLLFLKPDLPLDHPAWKKADSPALGIYFIYHNRVDADRMIFWGRMGIVACGCLLGFLVYLWASRLFGAISGLMALFLYCFSPNVLAHAGLATSDMTTACFIFLTVFSFWCFCRYPNWPRVLTVAVCLALAQLKPCRSAVPISGRSAHRHVRLLNCRDLGGICLRDGVVFVDRRRNAAGDCAAFSPASPRYAMPGPEFHPGPPVPTEARRRGTSGVPHGPLFRHRLVVLFPHSLPYKDAYPDPHPRGPRAPVVWAGANGSGERMLYHGSPRPLFRRLYARKNQHRSPLHTAGLPFPLRLHIETGGATRWEP
ncbi:MAG: hypothetical protein P8123_02475, partial [bacterium]